MVTASNPHNSTWPVTRDGRHCLVVGEVSQSHDGSLGLAHAFIDAIADSGADAVKFQTHIADAESTPQEPWRVKFSQQDASRYDYWKRMEFTEDQWHGLRKHALDRGLYFLSSPFSVAAVELLERVRVDAWKIASGEVANPVLLDRVSQTNGPIILSTGMSTTAEIDSAVTRVNKSKSPLTVLQCTSVYPCPPELVGLDMLAVFREKYACGVGLSDHSGTIYPSLIAASLGADLVEVHVALTREMFGPDVPSSITTSELRQLVEAIRFVERMTTTTLDKNSVAKELYATREVFTKSIVATTDLSAGTVLSHAHLSAKKPGVGIPALRFDEIVGKRLRRAIRANEFLKPEDLEE